MSNIFKKAFSSVGVRTALGLALMVPIAFQAMKLGGRSLTSGEVTVASSVFGSQIDYGKVRIHDWPLVGKNVITPNGQIYVGSSYKTDYACDTPDKTCDAGKRIFIHEMTHVWQRQHNRSVVAEAAARFLKTGGHYLDYSFKYSKPLESTTAGFKNLDLEQQAQYITNAVIVRDRALAEKDWIAKHPGEILCESERGQEDVCYSPEAYQQAFQKYRSYQQSLQAAGFPIR